MVIFVLKVHDTFQLLSLLDLLFLKLNAFLFLILLTGKMALLPLSPQELKLVTDKRQMTMSAIERRALLTSLLPALISILGNAQVPTQIGSISNLLVLSS